MTNKATLVSAGCFAGLSRDMMTNKVTLASAGRFSGFSRFSLVTQASAGRSSGFSRRDGNAGEGYFIFTMSLLAEMLFSWLLFVIG